MAVAKAKVEITEGGHGVRRGPPQILEKLWKLMVRYQNREPLSGHCQNLCLPPPLTDIHRLPSQCPGFWAAPIGGKLHLILSQKSLSYSSRQSSFNPLDHAEQVCPCLVIFNLPLS